MKPANDRISDWRYGLKPGQEAKTAEELIGFFQVNRKIKNFC
jgi:hypothetical protein